MSRMTIDDQVEGARDMVSQALQKLEEETGAQALGRDHKPKLPPSPHGRDHIQGEPASGMMDDRRLPDLGPGGSSMKIRPDSRLIAEKDLSAFPLGLPLNGGILLTEPFLNQGGILLKGLGQRFLTGEPELGQETADRGQGQAYPIFSPNQDSDHVARPEGEGEFELKRVFACNHLVDPLNLRAGELLRTAHQTAGLQCIPPSGPIGGQPEVNASAGKSQGPDDNFGAFPSLDLLNGTDADGFEGFVIEFTGIVFDHEPSYHKT